MLACKLIDLSSFKVDLNFIQLYFEFSQYIA